MSEKVGGSGSPSGGRKKNLEAPSEPGRRVSAEIISLFRYADFDTQATSAMGAAFEKCMRELHDSGQPPIVREIVAKRIIEVARQGVRDPNLLAERALAALGIR
jgi:hypothetical protein